MILRFRQRFAVVLRASREWLKTEFSFKLFVDVTTLIASIATVVTLIFLVRDRPEQANVAAWQLLQNYLRNPHRATSNQGQSYALETLVGNDVSLDGFDGRGITLNEATLRKADATNSTFSKAELINVDLTGAYFTVADLEDIVFNNCACRGVNFYFANLRNAKIYSGDFRKSNFEGADISGLRVEKIPSWSKSTLTQFDPDAFAKSCYDNGREPVLPGIKWRRPASPQSDDCKKNWDKDWQQEKNPSYFGGD